MINKLHELSPPSGLVSPSGGFASLLFDQVGHFASIKLCQAPWLWLRFSCWIRSLFFSSSTDLVLTQQIKPGHATFYKPKIGRREFSERQEFSVRQEFSIRHKFRGRPKFMVRPKFCVRRTENEKLRVRPKFMVRQKFCGRRKVSGRRKFSTNG